MWYPAFGGKGPNDGTHRIKLGAGSSIVQGWLAQPLGPEATVTRTRSQRGKSHLVPIKDNDTSRPWQRTPAPTTSISERCFFFYFIHFCYSSRHSFPHLSPLPLVGLRHSWAL